MGTYQSSKHSRPFTVFLFIALFALLCSCGAEPNMAQTPDLDIDAAQTETNRHSGSGKPGGLDVDWKFDLDIENTGVNGFEYFVEAWIYSIEASGEKDDLTQEQCLAMDKAGYYVGASIKTSPKKEAEETFCSLSCVEEGAAFQRCSGFLSGPSNHGDTQTMPMFGFALYKDGVKIIEKKETHHTLVGGNTIFP